MDKVLLVVAAGKSSRFGGFPKAFCNIGGITNVENTIKRSKEVVEKIYIGVNNKTYEQYCGKISDCELFPIKTGQGDAHSLLKCLKYVKSREKDVKCIMVCWGDAVFLSSKPFEEVSHADGKVNVVCALDKHPYAWFDVDDKKYIVRSHFAKEEGDIAFGMHDQSLFYFDMSFAIEYLDSYRVSLGIPENNNEDKSDENEMKLLLSFDYLNRLGDPAKCVEISEGQVLSFNTQEELKLVKKLLNQ